MPEKDNNLPAKMSITRGDGTIEIERRWLDNFALFYSIAVFVIDCILFVWPSILASPDMQHAETYVVFFAHLVASIGLTYGMIALWVNSTCIRVGKSGITVRHGPLPWFSGDSIDAADIKALTIRHRHLEINEKDHFLYTIYAEMGSRDEQKISGSFTMAEQADYVAEEIRNTLGLNDEPRHKSTLS